MSAGSSGCVLEMWVSGGRLPLMGSRKVGEGPARGLSPTLRKDEYFACLTEVQNSSTLSARQLCSCRGSVKPWGADRGMGEGGRPREWGA